ncbi:TetR/AcrR family transcriptional regulator [Paenibacillus daejeonensis]|uniref:TetR/AcrR family transcriptional regulator n=1 Tax=Paenibacillus daejeonensis TaxID=135193 RepID=UPI0003771CD2|nr:TetR/AcrR family transcriptional regulator [Paenibacillus daejeonensis]
MLIIKNQSIQSDQSLGLQQRFYDSFEAAAGDPVRRKIILHAVDVFSHKGFAGTKIKDIAESAGFSQGYVYTYYKSKEELFVQIVKLTSDGAANSILWASQLKGTPLERITWLTNAFISPTSIALQHWRFNLLLVVAPGGIPEEALTIMQQRRGEPFQHLIPLIVEGQRRGELRQEDPLMLAITYFSMLQGISITRIQSEGSEAEPPLPNARVLLRFMTASGEDDDGSV